MNRYIDVFELKDLVEVIEDVVKGTPFNDFEVVNVEYCRLSSAAPPRALINFKLFGYGISFGVDLESMESFGGAREYANYVVERVISDACETLLADAKGDWIF